jgi:formate-nitrite transporter family protein
MRMADLRDHQTRQDEPSFSPASKLDALSDRQRREIDSTSRPNAALIHETIRAEGLGELERSVGALLSSGLAAGLSMGFSLLMQGELHALLPEGPARDLISPLGYTTGFLIVVLGRQQLFTENTLTPILPLLHNRDLATLGRTLRLWVLVLAANLVGACLFASAVAHAGLFRPALLGALREVSRPTVEPGFALMFMRAMFAGWLIALMVWLLPAVEGSRPLIVIILSYIVALGGFSHLIAGSVDCAYLVASGQASFGEFFLRFFAPTFLGNVVGGIALVAILNYGQVAPEIAESE